MKKRIVAGVLALLLAASALPVNEFADFVPDISITASADEQQDKFKPFSGKIDDEGLKLSFAGKTDKFDRPYLSVTVTEADICSGYTTVTINTNSIRTAIMEQSEEKGYDIGKCQYTVLESYKGAVTGNKDIAHIVFSEDDTFIDAVGPLLTGCTNLQTVKFNDRITKLSGTFNGCKYFAGSGKDNIVELDNITEIGAGTFGGCSTLAGASFSSSLDKIDDNAFSGCIKLTNINIPRGTKFIGDNVFSGCTSLKSCTFESGSALSYMGSSVFSGCISLVNVNVGDKENTLPTGLYRTGSGVFSGCTSLHDFNIHKNFKYIPQSMFANCTALRNVTFEDGSECEYVMDNAFNSCSALISIELPSKVKAVGSQSFLKCLNLEKVIVPDDITAFAIGTNSEWKKPKDRKEWEMTWEDEQGKYLPFEKYDPQIAEVGAAFSGCPVLSLAPQSKKSKLRPNQVIMPDLVTYIPRRTFQDDIGLTNVFMPNVTDIGEYAFAGCKSLLEIDIPEAVKLIRDGVFKDCTSLHTVTYSYQTYQISSNAFSGCISLVRMTPHGVEPIDFTLYISPYMGRICVKAFANCSAFKYLNFVRGDDSEFAIMEEGAFSGCSSLEGSTIDGTSSEELRFPKKVVVIESTVFEKCISLKTIRFTGNVTSIGDSAFSNCSNMTRITLNPTVKQVGVSAFAGCKMLQQLPMTETGESALIQLEDIKDQTFMGCESIKEVDLSDAKNVEAIGVSAFVGCAALEKVCLAPDGKLGRIGNSAFANCSSLKYVAPDKNAEQNSLPDSVHTIGDSAFTGTSLENITIVAPANTTYYNVVGSSAFADCKKLKTIDLSKSNLTTLPKSFASKDIALTDIKLPPTLTAVQDGALDGCIVLEKINSDEKGVSQLPESLKSIGSSAFKDNHCISKVIIPAATDNINTNAWSTAKVYTEGEIRSGTVDPLREFVVDENNENFLSLDGVLYNKKGIRKLLIYPVAKPEPDYEVPEFVRQIAENSISNNIFLTSVKLTNNVSEIAKNSIKGCTGLRRVEFGGNNTVSIDSAAFTGFSGKPKIAFYAAKGSTAETYANQHSNIIEFIDNDKAAVSLTIAQGSRIRVLKTSGKFTLDAVLLDSNNDPTNDVLVWSSSNLDVVLVDNYGNVTPKGDGVAVVTVTSANGLSAQIEIIVGVTPITEDMITLPETSYVYDGTAKLQPVIVTIDDTTLTENTDYTISYTNNVNAGTATVTVKGIGRFAGTIDLPFTIAPASIENAQVSFAPDVIYYTGEPVEPFSTVTIGEKVLAQGRDYEVTFSDNIKVGTAKAVITGKGNYAGTINTTFDIAPIPISDMIIDLSRSSFSYNGGVQKPAVTIANNSHILLTEGKDYTVTIPESCEAGGYEVIITGIGGYCGEAKESYWITAKAIDDPGITASSKTETVSYDGSEKTIKVEVKDGKTVLKEGKDYTLSFEDNINVGTAYCIITGIGNYQNSLPVSFEITAKQVSGLTVKLSKTSFDYDGKPKTPDVSVYDGNKVLELDTDYTFTYENNTDPGTAYVVITGQGNYTGSAKIPFDIVSKQAVVERIFGANRFLTSVEISKKACSSADTVVIASGMSFADALAGVSYAKAMNAPILLVAQNSISNEMLDEIERLGAKKAVILGGEGAVGAKVVSAVKSKGLSVDRIAGKSRFDTAAEIASKLKDEKGAPESLCFVFYNSYADALSVSSIAGVQGAPVLYVKTKGELDDATKKYIASVKSSVKNVYVIGGTGVISDDMCKTIRSATGKTPQRVAGANRYETCVAVNKKFAGTVSAKTLCIATGADFPDALAGGVFAAMNTAPLFLVNGKDKKSTLSDTQTAYIKEKGASKLYVIGGTGAVSDAFVEKIRKIK